MMTYLDSTIIRKLILKRYGILSQLNTCSHLLEILTELDNLNKCLTSWIATLCGDY